MRSGRLNTITPLSPCTSVCTQSSAIGVRLANGTVGSGSP